MCFLTENPECLSLYRKRVAYGENPEEETKDRIMKFTDIASTTIVFTMGVYVAFICIIYIVQITCNYLPNNNCTIDPALGAIFVLLIIPVIRGFVLIVVYFILLLLVIMVVYITIIILFTKNIRTLPIIPLHHKIT
jgi:hypothetical protein